MGTLKWLRMATVLAAVFLVAACGGKTPAPGGQTNQPQKPAPTSDATKAADDSLEKVKAKGKLAIGVKADAPMFGYLDKDGKNSGFEIDMAHRLAKDLFGDENKIEFVPVVGANRIPYLQSGKIDVILATMGILPDRAKLVDFSIPYFSVGAQLLTPKDSSIKDIPDLNGKTVITIKGSTGDQGIPDLAPKAERLKFENTADAIQALKDQRGVAFAQDNTFLWPLAKQLGEYKVVGTPYMVVDEGLAVRKGDKALLDWINSRLEAWKKERFLEQLWDKHVKEYAPENTKAEDLLWGALTQKQKK